MCVSSKASWVSFTFICPRVCSKLSSVYLKSFYSKAGFFFLVLPEIIDFWWPKILYTLKSIFNEKACFSLIVSVNLGSGCASCLPTVRAGSFFTLLASSSQNQNSIEVHDGIIKYPSKKQELKVFSLFVSGPMLYNQGLLMCVCWVVYYWNQYTLATWALTPAQISKAVLLHYITTNNRVK